MPLSAVTSRNSFLADRRISADSSPNQPSSRLLEWNQQKASKRRSSVAVMASNAVVAQVEKEDQQTMMQSRMLEPQSRSAVHYLAISPPRIRITDAHGDYYKA